MPGLGLARPILLAAPAEWASGAAVLRPLPLPPALSARPAPPVLALQRLLFLVYSPAIPSTSPSSFCHFSFAGFLLLPLFPPFSSLYKRSK